MQGGHGNAKLRLGGVPARCRNGPQGTGGAGRKMALGLQRAGVVTAVRQGSACPAGLPQPRQRRPHPALVRGADRQRHPQDDAHCGPAQRLHAVLVRPAPGHEAVLGPGGGREHPRVPDRLGGVLAVEPGHLQLRHVGLRGGPGGQVLPRVRRRHAAPERRVLVPQALEDARGHPPVRRSMGQ